MDASRPAVVRQAAADQKGTLTSLAIILGARLPLWRTPSWLEAATVNSTGSPGCSSSLRSASRCLRRSAS